MGRSARREERGKVAWPSRMDRTSHQSQSSPGVCLLPPFENEFSGKEGEEEDLCSVYVDCPVTFKNRNTKKG